MEFCAKLKIGVMDIMLMLIRYLICIMLVMVYTFKITSHTQHTHAMKTQHTILISILTYTGMTTAELWLLVEEGCVTSD